VPANFLDAGKVEGMDEQGELVVCYNGACPVCRAEIEHYRRRAGEAADLAFLDVAADRDGAARLGISGDIGFRRLHIVAPDGRIVGGVPAFAAIWARLPGYRWLAQAMTWPIVGALAVALYERVAAPALYRLHLRRQRRASGRR
jgi:predicted DCC family thiol-disulfide oxidoreductase YuxK